MNITLCAKSKILNILEEGKAFRVQSHVEAGPHVDLIPNSEVTAFDSTISHTPLIVADVLTVIHMAGRSIDFDYRSGEFLIST